MHNQTIFLACEPRNRPTCKQCPRKIYIVKLRDDSIFECQIPLKMIVTTLGTLLRIRFSLWSDRLPLDALPEEGSIEIQVVPRSDLGTLAYAKP